MSCTLTEYAKPHPKYGTADAGWRPRSGWELADGRWQRWWVKRTGPRSQVYRAAHVWRSEGAWTWNVQERRSAGDWKEIGRDGKWQTFFTAQAAWPFADCSARQK